MYKTVSTNGMHILNSYSHIGKQNRNETPIISTVNGDPYQPMFPIQMHLICKTLIMF
ncbi:hypothetical protein Hanom_Chr11g00992351 [Helianthus anomalus]